MEIKEAILGRRSIRHFLKKDVPNDLINDLLMLSQWSPSWGNTQPWELMVVTGQPLAVFKQQNKDALFSGVKSKPDIQMPEIFPALLKHRYVDVGRRVLTSLCIDRKDLEGRLQYYGDMFYLFDAPALVLILLDKNVLLEYAMLDVGLFMQTFLLTAHDKGLGAIALAAAVHYPDILRSLFPIDTGKTIIIGIALGWPDVSAPVNCFNRQRANHTETITWITS